MGLPECDNMEPTLSICPETGLSILSSKEWEVSSSNNDYKASICLLDYKILKATIHGFSKLKDSKKTAELIDGIVPVYLNTGQGFIQIFDMAESTGLSIASRKNYIRAVSSRPGLLGQIFYNASTMFKISVRIGRKLNRVSFGVHIVNDYMEAVNLAKKIFSSELPATGNFQIDTTLKPFIPLKELRPCHITGLPVLKKPEWTNIRLGKYFSATFEIIGKNILLIKLSGRANEQEIFNYFDKRASIIESSFGSDNPFVEIKNYKNINTPPKALRNLFSKKMQDDKERCLGFIVYQASPGIRFSFNVGKRIIKPDYPVLMVPNYNKAVQLAVSILDHYNNSGAPPGPDFYNSTQDTPSINNLSQYQINHYVDELLLFLGNINWEIHGVDSNIGKIPSGHPFKLVFEAIALIKSDLDQLTRDRQKAVNALSKSEKLYRLLAENAQDVIWTADLNMTPLYYSPSVKNLTGYTIDELMKVPVDYPFVPESSKFAADILLEELLKEDVNGADPMRSVLLEFENIHKTGFIYWTEVKVAFLRAHDDKPIGLIGVSRDITERKQAESEIKKSLDELKKTQTQLIQSEKMAALGGLVAGVSHEISTPIGVSVTASSFLQHKTIEFEKLKAQGKLTEKDIDKYSKIALESSALISNNLQRAADLINSFKQVAVDQSNEIKRKFNVKKYTEEILQSLNPKVMRTNHKITLHCPDNIIFYSYPGAFSQIVTNLVMNSLIHGFEAPLHGEITIRISTDNENIIFEYNDNGKGMDENTIKKIYNPFYTTKRVSGGTGLGMHIVFNIVTGKLKGQINCTSTPGAGTSFLIQLPH